MVLIFVNGGGNSSDEGLLSLDATQSLPPPGVYLTPQSDWTNATLENELCPRLVDGIQSVTLAPNSVWKTRLNLPECFWAFAGRLTSFSSEGPIWMRGDFTRYDPLLQFSGNLTELRIIDALFWSENMRFQSFDANFDVNWSSFFSRYTLLSNLIISKSNIGPTLPSTWPSSLKHIEFVGNRFTGNLKSSWFTGLEAVTIRISGGFLDGIIPPNLFTTLPTNKTHLFVDFSNNRISGSLPPNLLVNSPSILAMETFNLNFDRNRLEGSLPPTILFESFSSLTTLTLSLDQNKLTGSISPTLFSVMTNLTAINLRLGNNQLSASIPAFLDYMTHLPDLTEIIFDLSNNSLSGSLPERIMPGFEDYPHTLSCTWYLDRNRLSGTLPPTLMERGGSFNTLELRLSQNALSGTIPSSFFRTGSGSENSNQVRVILSENRITGPLPILSKPRAINFVLHLDNNPIGGSLPYNFFYSFYTSVGETLTINLSDCGLTGPLPTLPYGRSTYYIQFTNNRFTGAYNFDQWIMSAATGENRPSMVLLASNNRLTGELNFPTRIATTGWLYLDLSRNSLNSMNLSPNMTFLSHLLVDNNLNMVGSIPPHFLDKNLITFSAANTRLHGTFPSHVAATSSLRILDLSNTKIDFCAARDTWTSTHLSTCLFYDTNARTCNSTYPAVCKFDRPNAPTSAASSAAVSSFLLALALLIIALCA